MHLRDTAVLQVIKLHDAFMQLVQTVIILALNVCILIVCCCLGQKVRD
jgi:hypothetical protein